MNGDDGAHDETGPDARGLDAAPGASGADARDADGRGPIGSLAARLGLRVWAPLLVALVLAAATAALIVGGRPRPVWAPVLTAALLVSLVAGAGRLDDRADYPTAMLVAVLGALGAGRFFAHLGWETVPVALLWGAGGVGLVLLGMLRLSGRRR